MAGSRSAAVGRPPRGQPVERAVELVRVIFGKEDEDGTGFAVWLVRPEEGDEFRAAAELPPDAWGEPGEQVTLVGHWTSHPTHGRQFAVDSVRPCLVDEGAGLVRWLARQKGIGQVTAALVARHLGPRALVRLAQDPDLVRQVPGLSAARAEAVLQAVERYQENQRKARVLIWAHAHGFGPAQAEAIWNHLGADGPGRLQQQPWLLAELRGFGFIRADELAQRLGINPRAPGRLQAALLFALKEAAQVEGHVYLPPAELVGRAHRLLAQRAEKTGYGPPPDPGQWQQELTRAVDDGQLTAAEQRIYLPALHRAERKVREWLQRRGGLRRGLLTPEQASRLVQLPGVVGQLDAVQASAVALALSAPAAVLTGGPGTGKTTTVKAVVAAIRRISPADGVHLAAPTGRAAKRLAEVTGHEAVTLHRLLDFGPLGSGGFGPRCNAAQPLPGLFLVVDESSMVDIELMAHLVDAVPDDMPVLFVGDFDQIPPVGPGAPFHAVVRQGLLPAVVLERIYRQGEGSAISAAAQRVNAGRVPAAGEQAGFHLRVYPRAPWNLPDPEREERARQIRTQMAAHVVAAVQELCGRRGFHPAGVQVLTPIRRGPCGVAELNLQVRRALNPGGRERGTFTLGRQEFWLGDRVVQRENNYDKGVFNGEIGIVVATDASVTATNRRGNKVHKPAMRVRFDDGREVPYSSGDGGELALAYALTIHKAQGSEYPAVVMVLTWDAYMLLQRQLVYTGMTRAARQLILLAEGGALERAVATAKSVERYQAL